MNAEKIGTAKQNPRKNDRQGEGNQTNTPNKLFRITVWAVGRKTGNKICRSCLETVAAQRKTEHVDRKNQLIDTKFFGTNQAGKEYSVIEPKNSGKKTGKSQNQRSG